MGFRRLKAAVTALLVGAHLLSFVWLFVLYLVGGFAFDDLTTAIALMMPLFAGYTTMIVKDAIAEAAPGAKSEDDRTLPANYAILTLTFTGGFGAYLLLILTLKGLNIGFESFDQFKLLLAVSETVFGVYVGYLLPTLFTHGGKIMQPTARRRNIVATKP